jgi:hypothetical protein
MAFEYELTPSQKELCAELEQRDMWRIAEACENAWNGGHEYYFDDRQGNAKGLKRKLAACNKQMRQIWDEYLSSLEYGIKSYINGSRDQAQDVLSKYSHRQIREAAVEFGGYSAEEANEIADAVKDGN